MSDTESYESEGDFYSASEEYSEPECLKPYEPLANNLTTDENIVDDDLEDRRGNTDW